MIGIVTVLLAFGAGYWMRSRFAARVLYAVAYLWAFTFQTLYLLIDSLGPSNAQEFPPGEFPLSYGLVTLGVFVLGMGLVELGHLAAARRSRKTQHAVAR
ncbi:MAG: hypothetical protein ABJA74_02005 [Lapillicoccus sp.]